MILSGIESMKANQLRFNGYLARDVKGNIYKQDQIKMAVKHGLEVETSDEIQLLSPDYSLDRIHPPRDQR
jgi:hypothetical protein